MLAPPISGRSLSDHATVRGFSHSIVRGCRGCGLSSGSFKREAEPALDAEPGHEARPAVAQEAEQVEARLTESELEWPTAAVAPLARQGRGR